MNVPVVQLSLSNSDQMSEFIFNIFMIKHFHSINFVSSSSSIESLKEWFKHRFSSFHIEIHDLEPENPWDEGGFGNPL